MDSPPNARPPSPARDFPTSGFEVVDDAEQLRLEEERFDWFSAETWYPVQIGEVLQDQYQVIMKMGYGIVSTNWFCRDLKNHRYVALKVCCTDSEAHGREGAAMEHIEAVLASPEEARQPCKKLIRRLLDRFTVVNPRARAAKPNVCLVYKPMGMTLADMERWSYDGEGVPVDEAKGITMYLLWALDFLHSNANVVHTDLRQANVMFSVEPESSLDAVLQEELSDPSPRKFRKDGHVIYKSRPVITGDIEYPTICDFGEARFGKDEYEEHEMPDLYRAPEILLRLPWSDKIDIWALGLMVWSMVEGRNLFRDSRGGRWQSALPHIARMVSLLGKPPQYMLDQSAATGIYFNCAGHLKGGHQLPPTSLEEEETKLEGDEKREFLRFVRRMLQWDPRKRPSARELAADPWPQSGLD